MGIATSVGRSIDAASTKGLQKSLRGLSSDQREKLERALERAEAELAAEAVTWTHHPSRNCNDSRAGTHVDLAKDDAQPMIMELEAAKAMCVASGYAGFTYEPAAKRVWRLAGVQDPSKFGAAPKFDVYVMSKEVIVKVQLTSLKGRQKAQVKISADGSLEGLHSAVATKLDVEPEQVKLIGGTELLADQGPLAEAGIPDFPESCKLKFLIGPVAEMTGYVSRYDSWCGSDKIGRASKLHLAAGTNDVESMEALLSGGIDANTVGGGEELPIHHAASLGCLDTAFLLIDKEAKVNASSKKGTALYHAIEQNPYLWLRSTSGVKDVAKHVEDVSAARHNLRAMLILLILAGADVETVRKSVDCCPDAVSVAILDNHKLIEDNGLDTPKDMAALLEDNPGLRPAKAAFKLLLERGGGKGFQWAARMRARREL